MYILGYQSPVFILNLYNRVKFLGKNFIFSVKSTNFSIFRDQMYILGYQTPVFIPNLYNRVKFLGKKFIFSVKSKSFSIFNDQMYILGYQSPVFIPNLYNRVKILGSVKSTNFSFFDHVHFGVPNSSFYPQFVQSGQIF